MKYYLDTEFLEGPQKTLFGYTKPTIDLISIGIVAEDGREYYAVSKDFNLKEAWDRHELLQKYDLNDNKTNVKVHWIRENVLKPIFQEFLYEGYKKSNISMPAVNDKVFTLKNLKKFTAKHGKTNEQIAREIKEFVYNQTDEDKYHDTYKSKPEFYGYYADYDWVVFCWLFGKMIDLPNGFPMYCIDLKQIMNEKATIHYAHLRDDLKPGVLGGEFSLDKKLKVMKGSNNYPKQTNEHSAIEDARWNKKLYEFLIKL
jgi:hypothetical protein